MKSWWSNLSGRDRRMLIFGAVAVAALMLYALIVDPLWQARLALQRAAISSEADLVHMQDAAQRLARLQGQGATGLQRAGRSLLALADASAREAKLVNAIKRMEPVSEGRVSVWIEAAPFDAVAVWLEQLEAQYGVRAEEFSFDRHDAQGQISGRVVLADPAS